ncbi:MAG: extracellular solute-binding protein [Eubacteriales bacterium]
MKRKILATLLSAAVVLSMVACGSTETATTETTETATEVVEEATEEVAEVASGEVVELSFFGFKTGTQAVQLEELIEQFNEENADINVTYEGITNAGGFQEVVTTRLASGQGDDIIFSSTSFISQLQQAGYLEDLSDLDIVDNYAQDMTVNGEVPGFAFGMSAFGMFANHDLLEELGLEVPKTYDDFMAACQTTVDAGLVPIIAGSADGTGVGIFVTTKGLEDFYLGGDDVVAGVAAIDAGEVSLAETLREGFEWAAQLRDLGYIDAEESLVMAPYDGAIAEFAKGETPFFFMGNWAVNDVRLAMPDTDITFEGIPSNNESPVLITDAGVRICINSKSEHKEEAIRFIEFMLSTENNDYYVAGQADFTVLKDGTSTDDPMVAPAAELLAAGYSFPMTNPSFNNIDPWDLAKTYGANLFAGADLETVIAELEEEVTNTILLK